MSTMNKLLNVPSLVGGLVGTAVAAVLFEDSRQSLIWGGVAMLLLAAMVSE